MKRKKRKRKRKKKKRKKGTRKVEEEEEEEEERKKREALYMAITCTYLSTYGGGRVTGRYQRTPLCK